MADTVVRFLEGLTTDGWGRQITEILDQDDWFWENTHDFIQWLFPLNEESKAVMVSLQLGNDTRDIRTRGMEKRVLIILRAQSKFRFWKITFLDFI
jgi:hypothetical protein